MPSRRHLSTQMRSAEPTWTDMKCGSISGMLPVRISGATPSMRSRGTGRESIRSSSAAMLSARSERDTGRGADTGPSMVLKSWPSGPYS